MGNMLLEGWVHQDWQSIQQKYYSNLGSQRTGKCWVIALLKKSWDIAWDLWQHRNQILHEQENAVTAQYMQSMDRQVLRAYR
jgi:hypothetical protein